MLGSDPALSVLLRRLLLLLPLPFLSSYVFCDYKNNSFIGRIDGGEHAVTEGIFLRRGDGELFYLFYILGNLLLTFVYGADSYVL